MWWQVWLGTLLAMLGCILLMSLGYLLSRKVIQGSCGGLAAGGCRRCGKGASSEQSEASCKRPDLRAKLMG